MDFMNLAKERFSVRKFSDKPIEKEKLALVLKAGQLAPTACNFQPQRILVLDSKDSLTKLKDCTRFHFDAPAALLVCVDKSKSWTRKFDRKNSGDIDASIVTTHLMLAAADLGLGTTWVMYFEPQKMVEAFGIPKDYEPIALLPIGYPAEDVPVAPGHNDRLPLESTVFYNHF